MASSDDVTKEFTTDAATSDNAIVHGVITSLSPMKKGDAQLRLVGSQDAQRKRLSYFEKDSSGITVEHCKIKRARQSYDMEVILKPTTKIMNEKH